MAQPLSQISHWCENTNWLKRLAQYSIVCLLVVSLGCSRGEDTRKAEQQKASPQDTSHTSEEVEIPLELWYVNYVLGERVGYERQSFDFADEDGRRLRKVSGESCLRVKRASTIIEMRIRHTCWETLEGWPVRFEVETDQGESTHRTKGEIRDGQLIVETEVAGQAVQKSLPCPANCRGFLGLQESLFEKPMSPREERDLTTLVPGLNDIAYMTLKANDYTSLQVGNRDVRTLSIQFTMTLNSGGIFRGQLWVDERGIIVKQETDSPPMTTILATRGDALEQSPDPRLDLVRDIRIPVKGAPFPVERAAQAVYKISCDTEDLSQLLPSDCHQTVKRLGPHTVELDVHPLSLSPEMPDCHESADPSTTQATLWVQSNAPEIIRMAEMAASGISDPQDVAPALAKFVYRTVRNKGYDHAFLSALEVAERKQGDCTEHAVLLAALARARGLPARVAVGLVLQGDAFYYHMWTEILVNGCWVGFDATRERGTVTPAYIKLGHDSLGTPDGLGAFLPAMKLIGQLTIEIVQSK